MRTIEQTLEHILHVLKEQHEVNNLLLENIFARLLQQSQDIAAIKSILDAGNSATIQTVIEKLQQSGQDLQESVDNANQAQPVTNMGRQESKPFSQGELSMDPLQPLIDQVAANTTVEGSAKALIDGFAARLAAAGTDPAKLAALASSLKTSSDALAASVAANTPAAPPAPPTTPPTARKA